jgi:hypothetical protein
MKKLLLLTFAILLVFSYALYLYIFPFAVTKAELEPSHPPGYYDYRGITHTHSILSTGSGTPTEIIDVANEMQLDFLFFTEVNPPDRATELEGYRGRLLVLTGGEYSYLDSRLMYYGAPETQPPQKMGQAQIYFADLLSQKSRSFDQGFVVLAHPLLTNSRWSGEYPEGLDGIEVLNLKSMLETAWRSSKLAALWTLMVYPFNTRLALLFLFESPREELELWDRLNRDRKVIGFMGTDATAKAILFEDSHLKFPSYETSFSIASNHLLLKSELTGNVENDKRKILEALKLGHFYMAIDLIANPRGFWAEVRADGRTYSMGSEIVVGPKTDLVIHLPDGLEVPFETVVFKDGEHYMTSNSQETVVRIQSKGVYRVIVRLIPTFPFPFGKRWISWIYTNPIYFR